MKLLDGLTERDVKAILKFADLHVDKLSFRHMITVGESIESRRLLAKARAAVMKAEANERLTKKTESSAMADEILAPIRE